MARHPVAAARQLEEEVPPEVKAFLLARTKLQELQDAFPDVFEALAEIGEEYNATLEAARKAVQARGVVVPPFQKHQDYTEYDGEALFAAVHEDVDQFAACGGFTETDVKYRINKTRFDALAAQRKIPPEVVKATRRRVITFKVMAKVQIP